MHLKTSVFLLVLFVFASIFALSTAYAAQIPLSLAPPEILLIPQSSSQDVNHEDYYFRQLLALALDKTKEDFPPYEIREHSVWLADSRLHASLAQGGVDIAWSVTSAKAEQQLLPIKISLLKDIGDYRVLLIRKNEQTRFSNIDTLQDLKSFVGGMGEQWPDAVVMRHNNLPIMTATGYGKFFKMLAAKRFDYFSRGLYQAQTEVNFYPELELQIEESLLLHYPNPYYFFVNKHNRALALRIEKGLKIALADRSFDQLFNSIPRYLWAQSELQSGKRKIIELPLPKNY